MTENKKYETLQEFWPFYLREHSNKMNRIFHFIGTTCALVFIVSAIFYLNAWYLLGALFSGYLFAWIGHFFLEKNRPATFIYPFKSFVSDWRMYFYTITGQLGKELEKAGVK
ncbi:hypothetical protein CH352_10590 [Leptospira hartskeerlii]|uniref:DUF962 domain-containing protein n=1 Tax=Leptospira hartskeerlii TaxID=2023177 RepID=A0A2M9XC20_9LEPT|nr:DUF962 domain-containing protein [Leptospira hartskeerlii]PJZ25245.1 hypothetical protein CH357_12395 [Leptospira hartskeerlii]PJZ33636.1 hypothetical protein CH352_10590 [Leptospira hartskeerlii]